MTNHIKTAVFLAALCHLPLAFASPVIQDASTRIENRAAAKADLKLFLFVHDQVTREERAQMEETMQEFLRQMDEIGGRRIGVHLIENEPGVTDFGYRTHDLTQLMGEWRAVSEDYANRRNLPRPSVRHKYVLVTSNKINWTDHGAAATYANVAIASLKLPSALPHELGHLFGATHERATGFPCQTIMWGNTLSTVVPCGYYSDANKEAIRDYVSKVE